jgi:5-methylcytosine-specific restriction enzyme B
LLPEPALLSGAVVEGLPLDEFLEALNEQVRRRFGREKQIGHSVLMADGAPISSSQEFADAFRYEVLPLLQEYAYGDYGSLASLLGDAVIDAEAERPSEDTIGDPSQLARALAAALLRP